MNISWLRKTRDQARSGSDTAEDWFVRLSRHDASEEEHDKFLLWLSESEEHSREWERVCTLWSLVGEAKEQIAALKSRHERLSASGYSRAGYRLPRMTWSTAGATGLAAVAIIVYLTQTWERSPQTILADTGPGETKTLTLAEGTTIIVGVKTSLTITENRLIDLHEGEAHFSTARSKAQPLLVRVGNDVLTSAESDFALRFVGEKATIAVEKGRVGVSRAEDLDLTGKSAAAREIIHNKPLRLRGLKQPTDEDMPEDGIILTGGEGVSLLPKAEDSLQPIEKVTSSELWQPGFINVHNETKENVIRELGRYYPQTIRIIKFPAQPNMVSVSLRVTSIQQSLDELKILLNFKVERSPDGEFLISFL